MTSTPAGDTAEGEETLHELVTTMLARTSVPGDVALKTFQEFAITDRYSSNTPGFYTLKALEGSHCETAVYIINRNFRKLSENDMLSIMEHAARHGQLSVLRSMIEWKAPTEGRSSDGKKHCPLFLAVLHKEYEAARLLLNKGADISYTHDPSITMLTTAVRNNDTEMVKLLASCGAQINTNNWLYKPPLEIAIICGLTEMTTTLLERGADPNTIDQDGHPLLNMAILRRALPLVESLVHNGAKITNTGPNALNAMQTAIMTGHSSVITFIKNQGAPYTVAMPAMRRGPAKTWTMPEWATCHADQHTATLVLKLYGEQMNEESPYFFAISEGRNDMVQACVDAGLDHSRRSMDEHNETPVYMAARLNRTACLATLIKAGANLETRGEEGLTPLMAATTKGCLDNVRLLVDQNIDLNARNTDGKTALHFATQLPETEITKILISRGADVNAKDNKGQTPLHWTIPKGLTTMTTTILHMGADPHILNFISQDAFGAARMHKRPNMIKLLEPHESTTSSPPQGDNQEQTMTLRQARQITTGYALHQQMLMREVQMGYQPLTVLQDHLQELYNLSTSVGHEPDVVVTISLREITGGLNTIEVTEHPRNTETEQSQ